VKLRQSVVVSVCDSDRQVL